MQDSIVKRFGVSMEAKLLRKFDFLVRQQGYENRSEALRDLVRDALIKQSLEDSEQMVAGSILLFYDHHQNQLVKEMSAIQHRMHELILATTHFHLDYDCCLELIVVKGKVKDVEYLSQKLTSIKGVEYGKFTVAPVGKM